MANNRQLRNKSQLGNTRSRRVQSQLPKTARRGFGATSVQLQQQLGNRGAQSWLVERAPVQQFQMKEHADEIYRREAVEEELVQRKFSPMQLQGPEEEQGLVPSKFAANATPAQFHSDQVKTRNRTGMSDPLKTGLEELSGMTFRVCECIEIPPNLLKSMRWHTRKGKTFISVQLRKSISPMKVGMQSNRCKGV